MVEVQHKVQKLQRYHYYAETDDKDMDVEKKAGAAYLHVHLTSVSYVKNEREECAWYLGVYSFLAMSS